MNNYKLLNIAKDDDFQIIFDRFYKIRRNNDWRSIYYTYFQSIKDKTDITFKEVLIYLYKKTGNIEVSFASKMIATINKNMPIVDHFVLSKLGLEIVGKSDDEKMCNAVHVYNQIIQLENDMLKTREFKRFIKCFKKDFYDYDIPDIKILDFYLWTCRN